MRPRPLSALVLLLVVGVTACASGSRKGGRAAGPRPSAVLEVQNDFLGPVNLFVVRDGVAARRLGNVFTNTVRRFTLGSEVVGVGGMVDFVAVPVTGGGRATTGRMLVNPGDTVSFNITNNLRASTVFVR